VLVYFAVRPRAKCQRTFAVNRRLLCWAHPNPRRSRPVRSQPDRRGLL
jgi:hypothetical protein